MRLPSIDPRSHKVQTKLYKIPMCGVNRPKSKQDRGDARYTKSMYALLSRSIV